MKLLRAAFANKWRALTAGWMLNQDVLQLCDEVERLRAAVSSTESSLRLLELEIEDLRGRLEAKTVAQEKTTSHLNKLWQFIAIRHRVDIPVEPGTIREVLQKASER